MSLAQILSYNKQWRREREAIELETINGMNQKRPMSFIFDRKTYWMHKLSVMLLLCVALSGCGQTIIEAVPPNNPSQPSQPVAPVIPPAQYIPLDNTMFFQSPDTVTTCGVASIIVRVDNLSYGAAWAQAVAIQPPVVTVKRAVILLDNTSSYDSQFYYASLVQGLQATGIDVIVGTFSNDPMQAYINAIPGVHVWNTAGVQPLDCAVLKDSYSDWNNALK